MATNQPTTPLSSKEIAELRSLVKLLGKELSDLDINDLLKNSKVARTQLESLRFEAKDLNADLSDVSGIFNDIIGQLKNTKVGINETTKVFQGLNSIARDLLYYQEDTSEATEKDLKSLQEKLDRRRLDAEIAQNTLNVENKNLEIDSKKKENLAAQLTLQYDLRAEALKRHGIDIKNNDELKELEKQYKLVEKDIESINTKLVKNQSALREIEGIVKGTDANYNLIDATIKRANTKLEEQNRLLGAGGGLMDGLQKGLSNIGLGKLADSLGIDEAQSKMKALANQIVNDKEKEADLTVKIKNEEENLVKNLEQQKQLKDEIASGSLSNEEVQQKQSLLDTLKEEHTERSNILSQDKEEVGNLSKKNAQFSGMKGQFKVLAEGAKAFGENLKKSLGPAALIAMAIEEIIDAMKIIDSGAGDMAKSMNMTYSEALKTREELGLIADLSGDAAVQTKDLQESLMAVNKALGSNARLNEADLVTMTKLTKQAGFTHDELMGIQKLSLVNGKKLEDNTKEVLGSAKAHASMRGLMINEKDVLREVNKMSASLKLSLGGSADKMAEAVVKTKALGLSIEQAEKMADGLLQFESSISSEMEAEMLTGKALNFEKARLLALNNDVAGAAEEIAKQVGSSADFTKMNRIQQEALAKAAGMTRDELAQSLMDREALANLSGIEGKTAKERFDTLVRTVGMEEAKKRLGNEELARQYEQQSVQERFNQTVEKLKEVFTRIAEPLMGILDPIMEVVESLMPLVNILFLPLITSLKLIGKLISISIVEPIKFLGDLINEVVVEPFKSLAKSLVGPMGSVGDIIDKFILNPFRLIRGMIWDYLVTPIRATGKFIATYIAEPFKAVKEFLGGIIDIFTGDFGEGLAKMGKGILRAILTPVQAIMNAGISVINSAIKIVNKIPGIKIGEVTEFNLADSIMGDDVVQKAGYGKRTLLGPEGSIKLNDNDTVIAGTKLLDDPNKQFQQQPSIEAPQSSSIFSKILQSITAPISMMSKGAQSILGSVLPSTSDESSSILLDVKNVLVSIHDIISKGISPGVIEKVKTSESSSLATNASKEINTLSTDSNKISATADFTQMNRIQQEALTTANSITDTTVDKSKDSSVFASLKEVLFKISPALNLASKMFSSEDKSKETIDTSKDSSSFTSLKETLFKINPILGLASKLFSSEDKSKETTDTSKEIVSLVSSQNDKTKELTSNTVDTAKEASTKMLSTTDKSKEVANQIKSEATLTDKTSQLTNGIDVLRVNTLITETQENKDASSSIIDKIKEVFTSGSSAIFSVADKIKESVSSTLSTSNESEDSSIFTSVKDTLLKLSPALSLASKLFSSENITDKTKSNDLTKINSIQQEALVKASESTETNKSTNLKAINTLDKNINVSNIDNASKINAKLIDKSNVSNLNTLASSSINDVNKSTDTASTTSLNAVNALNKTDLSNLIVNAENVSVIKSKSSEENKSSILDIFNPVKMISTITDLFTGKSEAETTKTNDLTDISKIASESVNTLKASDLTTLVSSSLKSADTKLVNSTNVANTLDKTAVSDLNKSVLTNESKEKSLISNINAVNALNKTDLTNLTVQAENVTITSSKTNEENKSSILDIINPVKILSKITDLFTSKSGVETTKTDNLTNSFLNKTDLTESILTNTKNLADKSVLSETEELDRTKELNKTKELDKTKEVSSGLDTDKLKEELLVSKKTNELALTSIDNLKVANLIVEKQQTEETTNNKGMLTGAAIGSFLGPLGALAGGLIGEMFSSSEEKITSANSEPLLQPQSLISSDATTTNSSTSINNNQNITSDENVVKILREAVTVLKAIQAKDTNVQLSVDGDVIARKITPNVSREQIKTYSSIG